MAKVSDERIHILKMVFKTQDKLIKLLERVRKLPAAQKKKVEAMLGGPIDDEKINSLIKKNEESKRQLDEEIEKKGKEKKGNGGAVN